MDSLLQNIKFALRSLKKSPGFTAVAILTLALGIGANTAIFSVVNAVLLQPLSYPAPDRLVQLQLTGPDGTSGALSIPNFNVMSAQTQAFAAVAVFDFSGPGINLTGSDRPEQLKGIHVSSGYFQVFGAPIAMGRAFTAEEDRPAGPSVALISNGLWHSRFGADPNILGRTLELSGDPYTVIGVLGANFQSDPKADIWLPVRPDPNSINQGHYLLGAARMRDGVTIAQANAAMAAAADEFRRRFPGNAVMGPKDGFKAQPLRDAIVGDARKGLLLMFGAVGFVLLIACANVANLLLARANIRKREIAIRSALGAGRGRLIGQLLTESVMLSLAGGILGLVFGFIGVRWLLSINPGDIPRIGDNGAGPVNLDWRVLAFTFVAAVVTGILFGLVPALQSSRLDLSVTLRESGARTGSGVRHNKMRSILVVTEMALALVLLVGAALLIRTFAALRGVDPGFSAKNVLTMDMSLAGQRFEKAASRGNLGTRRPPPRRSSARRRLRRAHLLPAARRRLRSALQYRGPGAERRPVHRQRRLDGCFSGLFQGVPNSSAGGPRLRRSRFQWRGDGRGHQPQPWKRNTGPRATRSARRSSSAKTSAPNLTRARAKSLA